MKHSVLGILPVSLFPLSTSVFSLVLFSNASGNSPAKSDPVIRKSTKFGEPMTNCAVRFLPILVLKMPTSCSTGMPVLCGRRPVTSGHSATKSFSSVSAFCTRNFSVMLPFKKLLAQYRVNSVSDEKNSMLSGKVPCRAKLASKSMFSFSTNDPELLHSTPLHEHGSPLHHGLDSGNRRMFVESHMSSKNCLCWPASCAVAGAAAANRTETMKSMLASFDVMLHGLSQAHTKLKFVRHLLI